MSAAAAPAAPPSAADLELLLCAPSREALSAFLSAVFRGRSGPASETEASRACAALGLAAGDAPRAVAAARALVSGVLYDAPPGAGAAEVAARLPAGLEPRLAALLAADIGSALASWREAAAEARPGPPRLRAAAWEVSVADGSSALAKFGTAVCALSLAVQDAPASRSALPAERTVRLELTHASLTALVDSMRRARDALAAVS